MQRARGSGAAGGVDGATLTRGWRVAGQTFAEVEAEKAGYKWKVSAPLLSPSLFLSRSPSPARRPLPSLPSLLSLSASRRLCLSLSIISRVATASLTQAVRVTCSACQACVQGVTRGAVRWQEMKETIDTHNLIENKPPSIW